MAQYRTRVTSRDPRRRMRGKSFISLVWKFVRWLLIAWIVDTILRALGF
jgi:hypothetical protein